METLTRMRMDGCSGPNTTDDNKRDETPRQRNFEDCEHFIEVKRLDAREKSVRVPCSWWAPRGWWNVYTTTAIEWPASRQTNGLNAPPNMEAMGSRHSRSTT